MCSHNNKNDQRRDLERESEAMETLWLSSLSESIGETKVVTALIVVVVASAALVWKLRRRNTAAMPPGPRGVPVVGYLPFLGTDLHRDFERLGWGYGPIFKLWLGQKMCVVVASPELVREVVRDQDKAFANRDPTVSTLVGSHGGNDIAFANFGPEWKNLRKVLYI